MVKIKAHGRKTDLSAAVRRSVNDDGFCEPKSRVDVKVPATGKLDTEQACTSHVYADTLQASPQLLPMSPDGAILLLLQPYPSAPSPILLTPI